jgi:DNA-binding response OmpR family regulator
MLCSRPARRYYSAMATVLVVEDEETLRKLLVDTLQHAGFSTLEAGDGESGYKVALNGEPDLILLDNMLPRQSGYSLLRQLRASGNFGKTVPVIFLSNVSPESDEEFAALRELYPSGYLPKSNNSMADIVTKVRATLGQA